jgi:hypothetical protein
MATEHRISPNSATMSHHSSAAAAYLQSGPPLLLTKRLTSYLHSRLAQSQPHIHTVLLATPTGKLLAHASALAPDQNVPVRTLRTQTAVAASLWAMHEAETWSESVRDALGEAEGDNGGAVGRRNRHDGLRAGQGHEREGGLPRSSAITVQLESGAVFVIRKLRCGLLFVGIGPEADATATITTPGPSQLPGHVQGSTSTASTSLTNGQHSPPRPPAPGSPTSENTSELSAGTTSHATTQSRGASSVEDEGHESSAISSVPTAVDGLVGAGGGGTVSGSGSTGVSAIRRRAEEIARGLDERLGALSIPDEGLGDVR